eukprot:10222667-Alexandrium_andersonii.AAC.1
MSTNSEDPQIPPCQPQRRTPSPYNSSSQVSGAKVQEAPRTPPLQVAPNVLGCRNTSRCEV